MCVVLLWCLENLLLHIPPGLLYREYQSGSLGYRAPLSYDMLYDRVSVSSGRDSPGT